MGYVEDEAGHLHPTTPALPTLPAGDKSTDPCPLEAPRGQIQGQPQNWHSGARAGHPYPHVLPTGVPEGIVGRRGLGVWIQIRQQRQGKSCHKLHSISLGSFLSVFFSFLI